MQQAANISELFNAKYKTLFKPLRSYIYKYVRDMDVADDLTSESLIIAFEKFETFDEKKGNFKTWVYKIAKNKTLSYLIQRKQSFNIISLNSQRGDDDNSDFTVESVICDLPNSIDESVFKNVIKAITDQLDLIENKQSVTAFKYRYIDNLTFSEIANKLNQIKQLEYDSLKASLENAKKNRALFMEISVKLERFGKMELFTESQIKTMCNKTKEQLQNNLKHISLTNIYNDDTYFSIY